MIYEGNLGFNSGGLLLFPVTGMRQRKVGGFASFY